MTIARDEQVVRALRSLEVPEHAPRFFDELAVRLDGHGAVPVRRARVMLRRPSVWLVSAAAAMALLLGSGAAFDDDISSPGLRVSGAPERSTPSGGPPGLSAPGPVQPPQPYATGEASGLSPDGAPAPRRTPSDSSASPSAPTAWPGGLGDPARRHGRRHRRRWRRRARQ